MRKKGEREKRERERNKSFFIQLFKHDPSYFLQICLVRIDDVDIYEVKTCRSLRDVEVWAQATLELDKFR